MLEGLVSSLLNRFLGAYIENFDPKQLNVGIWSGDVKLRNLKLKREALDKFRLPVDACEGYVGDLTLSIPWSNLARKPVRVVMENIFLLATPKINQEYDEADDQRRAQAVKQEKLDSAEILNRRQLELTSEDSKKNQSFAESLTTKIIDNLQITIRNIHIRYEDSLSSPGNPFSVGLTLAEFSALSTDSDWQPAFVQGSDKLTYKLAKLSSLAVYWNTDAESIAGKDTIDMIRTFDQLISKQDDIADHQYVLRPVNGTGKITMNKLKTYDLPGVDIGLLFDEIALAVDQDQYRDALMMVDTFHFFLRHQEYRKYRPKASIKDDPRAWLKFGFDAVHRGIHERRKVWTWDHMRERRNQRKRYIELYKLKQTEKITVDDSSELKKLEEDLAYEDIRFYRSLAKNELKKENALKPKHVEQQAQGWLSWAWSGAAGRSQESHEEETVMTDEQRKELYEAIEWDEKQALADGLEAPEDSVKMQITARLKTGSFALRKAKSSGSDDVIRLLFDTFGAQVKQRPKSFYANLALASLRLIDGTTPGSLYTDMAKLKDGDFSQVDVIEPSKEAESALDIKDPLFYASFESQPLSRIADTEVVARLKAMEIIYNPICIETLLRFIKPPKSQIESINALMAAASEAAKDYREQGRASLEFALSEHKTVAAHLDLQAPLIIVPESVTRKNAPCIVLDAGKIHIESDLVKHDKIKEIQSKDKEKLDELEMKELQSLCYDKFMLRLEDTQILIGPDIDQALVALRSESDRRFHVVDRINMNFLLEISILPKAASLTLTKFRISGHLPSLNARVSDEKYKTMMRIIDVAVPKDDTETALETRAAEKGQKTAERRRSTAFKSAFSRVPDLVVFPEKQEHDDDDDKFLPAPEGPLGEQDILYQQKTFELKFTVGELKGSLYKASPREGEEDEPLVDVVLQQFALNFFLRQYDMQADVVLRSLVVEDRMNVESPREFQKLVTSEQIGEDDQEQKDLVHVKYTQVKPASPDFQSTYGGIEKHVDVALSTINVIVTQKSILTLFDFVLTTFTSPDAPAEAEAADGDIAVEAVQPPEQISKMRVKVELTSIVLVLNQDGIRLATIKMSKGDVGVFMNGGSMRVGAKIGNFSVRDDVNQGAGGLSNFRQIISIEGDELADFRYETFDPLVLATYPGYDSSAYLRLNSIKINFLEEPLRKILNFGAKFARMKALFDDARNAALSQVQQVQQRAGKMHFDLLVRTPIVVFPRLVEATAERDVVVANLGELFANNQFGPLDDREESPSVNKIQAGIRNIALSSKLHYAKGEVEELQMIDDADAMFDIMLVEHEQNSDRPQTQVTGHVSDISLKLTRSQYKFLMDLTRTVPGVFVGDGADEEERELSQNLSGTRSGPSTSGVTTPVGQETVVDLEPELGTPQQAGNAVDVSNALDAVLTVGTLSLEIFENDEHHACGDLEKASLSKFLLSTTKAKFATRSDGSSQGEVNVKALTVSDTRHDKPSKFREVIPAVQHDGHQFNASVTISGGLERALMAMLTIDTPRIIFSLEHIFALQHWAMSAFEQTAFVDPAEQSLASTNEEPEATMIMPDISEDGQDLQEMQSQTKPKPKRVPAQPAQGSMSIAYRVNVVDPSIILVANPTSSNSEAIVLSAKQVLLTQQSVMMLAVDGVSMYLCRMDKPDTLKLRLLDNFAINLSLDSRTNTAQQTIKLIEIDIEPLVLRVSLRDILIALQIAQKASQLSAASPPPQSEDKLKTRRGSMSGSTRRRSSVAVSHGDNRSTVPNQTLATRIKDKKTTLSRISDQPGIISTIINREELKATFQGLRLVLIGDLHELPILDMSIGKFLVNIRDWSSDMTLDTNIEAYANVYNFSNSHWEPLIEPWQMGVHIGRSLSNNRTDINVYSRKRIEMTLTSSTIALASKALQYFNENEDVLSKPRGVDASYRIINMTGYPLSIWSEGVEGEEPGASKIADGEEIPWSFSDWHFQRESLSVDAVHSHLGIKIEDSEWQALADVPVNREGEKLYSLKSASGAQSSPQHRMVVEVKLRADYVKVVTLRSALLFENRTQIPIEVVGIDQAGNKQTKIYKVAPGEDCAAPIRAAFDCGIKIRPDPGFRYQWSHQTLYWKELSQKPGRTLNCKPLDEQDSTPFNFQVFSRITSGNLSGKYPYQRIRISPPVEISNLLPYDFNFKIYDDTVKKDWSNFLRKGLRSPVHTVDLAHVLLLAIQVQDSQPAYEPSQYSVIHTNNPDDFRREERLALLDGHGMKTKLGLHFTEVPDSGGAFVVSVFAPYLILNKTGLDIQIRSANSMFLQKSRNGTGVMPSSKDKAALPYLHSYANDDRKNRAVLRVGDSSWSSPQSFEAIGSVSEVTITAPNDKEVHLGIKVDEGEGKYKLTKVVTLTPRFVLKSNLTHDLMIREPASSDILYLKAGELLPVHFMRQVVARQLSVCLPGADNDWSNPFNIQDVGRNYVKVQRRGEHQKLLKIEILLEGATLFLHINQEDKNWPFIIRNESSCDFIYYQGNPYIEDGEETGKRVPYKPQRYKVPARSIMPYAWDYPAAKSPVLILSPTRDDARVRHLRLSEIGALEPFKVPADPKRQTNGGIVDLNVVAEGPTRKLIIKNRDPKTSLYRQRTLPLHRERDKLIRTDSSSSIKDEFEAVVDSKAAEVTLKASLRFEGIGLSLINSRHKELAYLTTRGIEVNYSDSACETTYDVLCKWIQIDNQLYGGIYPILLYPTVIPKTGREIDLRPAFHQKIILAKDTSHGVIFVKYASILMQEFTLEVDEDFLFAVLDFSKVPGASWAEAQEGQLCDARLTLPEPNREAESNDIYFEVLHLHPFSLNLSFVRTERVNVEDKTSSQNPLMFFFNILTMAVGNINEAPVRLNALLMENVLTSYPMLSQAIQSHYGEEFFFQVHKILGSADFLGNPVGLFNNITSGFADIFYEPYQGFILSDRRGEIPIGIAKGTASFVKKTVFGISDSFSKVTGSVSKGLSVATMDKQFQERRRMTRARNRPKHALYGVQSGGMALLSSFGSGVEGLARQPFEGAEKEGAAGFFKGVGKGVLGLVTKPVIGVFDLASNVSEGIRNTTTVFDSEGIDKVRLPRHVGKDGVVRPYNENEALGLFWLHQLNNGKFQKENYLAHYNLTDGTMLLITYETIMLCKLKGFDVEWDISFSDLKTILMEKEGLKLILKGNQRGPLIPIQEESGRKFVYSKIKVAVQAYNSQ
ncbi:vacuolar protein sorting-associated protein vps13 [Protomyces lactucae-debilis]|uniref:Vacuolar protein sorting-associated protein n=1 Tax=Protomyces lactucae-debilis TaxID=2754530 RepID=A0A1Y2F0D4_PROLT|nr:vacuolar protein sorting-associated protein vps13 [Protomyces lactucae-debilis]ORY77300.1 vacuolar protein sorting-associated protein vps13 [Protomyces lactucae-debilis]